MRTLEHRADHNRELLAAGIALVEAVAALNRRGILHDAAMAANRALWPKQAFQPFSGLGGVLKELLIQRVRHGLSPVALI